jgi:hypothetical protein
MCRRARVSSSLVLLLVMLGLPVSPVVCELACPQPGERAAATETSPQVPASAARVAPCHEAAAPDRGTSGVVAPDLDFRGSQTRVLHADDHRGCDHPAVVSSPRSPDSLRLPAPRVVAAETSQHLSPQAAAPAMTATLAAARAPSRAPAASLSLVLRI